jgi:predicted HTH transcriptional regulator
MGYSVPQNKELMRVFRDLDMVEQLGSGVPRILEHYPRSIYHFTTHFIRLVMPFTEGFNQHTKQASDQASELLLFCNTPRSIKEIMEHMGLKHRTYLRNTLLNPLLISGKLLQTIPSKPSSPNQCYVAAKKI